MPTRARRMSGMADESGAARPGARVESYLKAELIIDACKATGAEAVHPGYGFLSRARELRQGARQGRDRLHRAAAQGHRGDGRQDRVQEARAEGRRQHRPRLLGDIATTDEAVKIAKDIGYPVMMKASAGGGGKGMRLAWSEKDVREGFEATKREGLDSFGDDRVFIEKFIEEPRHIEIQVLGDQHGNVLYLGERECSIQRRHQKVVEEAPSPFVTPEMREAMGEQAVALARAVGYYSRRHGRADRLGADPTARASTSSR